MSYVDALVAAHLQSIEDNPTEILVFRKGRVKMLGGFQNVEEFVGVARARLYQETTGRSGKAAVMEDVAGRLYQSDRWGVLWPTTMRPVDPDTGVETGGAEIPLDVQISPNVQDSFTHPELGRFEVKSLYPRQDLGVTWGYMSDVEEIK